MLRDELPLIKKTFALVRSMPAIGLIYIGALTVLQIPYLVIWETGTGARSASFGLGLAFLAFLQVFIDSLFCSALYGLILLGIKPQSLQPENVAVWAKKKYLSFLRINLLMFLFMGLAIVVYELLLAFSSGSPPFHDAYPDKILSLSDFLVKLLFVFALPAAAIEFHFGETLKPLRMSFLLVIKQFHRILFVVLLLAAQRVIVHIIIKVPWPWPRPSMGHAMMVLDSDLVSYAIDYVIIVYSFVFLMEGVFKERFRGGAESSGQA